jgi:hypothetical protein
MIRVSNSVRLSQSEVPRDILSIKIAPRLGSIDLRPLIHQAAIHSLLGRNPIVSTGTETHALIEVFLPAEIVQPVREKKVRLCGHPGDIPSCFVKVAN